MKARVLAWALACAAFAALPAQAQPASEADALHVLNRLGYGPAPGDLAHVRQVGIDRYIDEQLHPERLPLPADLARQLDSLPTTAASQRELITQYREAAQAVKDGGDEARAARREALRQLDIESGQARLWRAARSPRQLEERMVDFWFNHFNVFVGKGLDRVLVGNYEREAIRPYAMGRFRDLLGATAHHPAMLFYLDNWQSVAAGSQPPPGAGPAARASGLNENYARELMELHTLGVDGGYSQQDVTELARVLTGWTFAPRLTSGASVFVFDARRHDRGDKFWLGQRLGDQGQAEGERALDLLAMHPATARHIGYQLAQYFVADQPPAALVDRLAQRYLASGGDIRALLQTLFASPEFRSPKVHGQKFKTPYDYVVSSVRAADWPSTADVRPLLGTLRQLGMPLYGCQTPDGYKNTQEAWLNPDAITRRIAFATALASGRLPAAPTPPVDAQALLATLGAGLSPKTRAALAEATPELQAPLALGSPDFMHR